MTLEELFKNLSVGVLSNLAVGDEGSGLIPHQFESKLVHAVNQGLTQLHARFILHENEVQIRAYDQITTYPLKRKYADQDLTVVPQKFISDSAEKPFLEDVIRVLSIYDEEGTKLLLNSPDPLCKVFTPRPTEIRLTEPVTGDSYLILYQAKHPKLEEGDFLQEIELPDVLHPALEHFVAYTILSPMNGQEHAAKAAENLGRYEQICISAEEDDLVSTSKEEDSEKFCDRGFL